MATVSALETWCVGSKTKRKCKCSPLPPPRSGPRTIPRLVLVAPSLIPEQIDAYTANPSAAERPSPSLVPSPPPPPATRPRTEPAARRTAARRARAGLWGSAVRRTGGAANRPTTVGRGVSRARALPVTAEALAPILVPGPHQPMFPARANSMSWATLGSLPCTLSLCRTAASSFWIRLR